MITRTLSFLLFLFIVGRVNSIKLINYQYEEDEEERAFDSDHFSLEEHSDGSSNWIVFVKNYQSHIKMTNPNDNNVDLLSSPSLLSHFLQYLKRVFEENNCKLYSAAVGKNHMVFRIKYEKQQQEYNDKISRIKIDFKNGGNGYTGGSSPSITPRLTIIEKKLIPIFGITNVIIEENVVYENPKWYGRVNNIYDAIKSRSSTKKGEYTYSFKDSDVQTEAPWGLDRIDDRWGLPNNEYVYNHNGTGVDIYIIDTGIRETHEEFSGRASFILNTIGDGINTDCHGHGTHVAGIAASDTFGVAKKSRIFGIKVLNCQGFGSTFTIVTGIIHVIDNIDKTKRSVVNFSLGGPPSASLDNAVSELVNNHNIPVVVAAGNEGSDACDFSPARVNDVLTVGASDSNDIKPSWSNFGSCVQLSAPGHQIISTWASSDSATVILSGTSMSSPFATGVIALILQQDPSISSKNAMTTAIDWTTKDAIAGTTQAGGGSDLLYSKIDLTQSPPITPPSHTPPSPTPNGSTTNNKISLIFIYVIILLFLINNI